jgi:hypothetical protein
MFAQIGDEKPVSAAAAMQPWLQIVNRNSAGFLFVWMRTLALPICGRNKIQRTDDATFLSVAR